MVYIDLTQTFTNSMPVFPGDFVSEFERVSKDGIVDHKLTTGMHVGTHMDAPLHMVAGGKYLSDFPPEKFFGRAVLINAFGKISADVSLLSNINIKKDDIVLIYFGFGEKFRENVYYKNYPVLTEEFAKKLVELGVSVIGMDTPSPDTAPYSVHKILLSAEILIIENLTNLNRLTNCKNFEIVALPIKLQTEAAPCRVVAKILC